MALTWGIAMFVVLVASVIQFVGLDGADSAMEEISAATLAPGVAVLGTLTVHCLGRMVETVRRNDESTWKQREARERAENRSDHGQAPSRKVPYHAGRFHDSLGMNSSEQSSTALV